MIQKIKSIASFGVFNGFVWDSCVLDPEGKVQEFKKLNIFYGRNYSGKTSLSRIFRAMETQKLPEKIENPTIQSFLDLIHCKTCRFSR